MRVKAIVIAALLSVSAGGAQAQFGAAAEVKPILKVIKADWISVREWDGEDLVYFSLLEVYRCGIEQVRYIINDGKPRVWEMEPCEDDEVFSSISEDRLPFVKFPLKSVERVRVELTYGDGTSEWGEYARDDVLD